MSGFSFTHSLIIAACLHGLTFLSLPHVKDNASAPPPTMLKIRLGTNFGNAFAASPNDNKTLLAATPHIQPPTPKPVTIPLKIETSVTQVPLEKQPLPLRQSNAIRKENGDIPMLSPASNVLSSPPPQPTPPAPTAQLQQASNIGSPLGNSTAKNAEHLLRYEQLLALWIHKFKHYPAEARMKNQEGTAILHLVIDRSGRILKSELSTKTGYTLLDEAVIDMVKQAKTVPAVPDDYPGENELEFQIPIRFTLQSL